MKNNQFYSIVLVLVSILFSYNLAWAGDSGIDIQPKSVFPPPGYKGIHQLDSELHKDFVMPLSEQPPKGLKPIPLNTMAAPGVNRIVFGYLPYWEASNTKIDWLRYNVITHIAWHSVAINTDGTISNPNSWPNTYLINKAHANGTKVLLSATNFSSGATFLASSTARYTSETALLSMVSNAGADGITIDLEALSYSPSVQSTMSLYMKELATVFHNANPNYHVSMAIEPLNTGPSGVFDLNALSDSCDSLFIMWYNFYGSWNTFSGPQAPLAKGGDASNTSQMSKVNSYIQNSNFRPSKIVMGYPLYGERWNCTAPSPHSSGSWGGNVTAGLLTGAATSTRSWDTTSQTPWYYNQTGATYLQTWYESPESLGYKYDLINSMGLGGVGYWAFAYDYSSTQYWDSISTHFWGLSTTPTGIANGSFDNTRSNWVNWEFSNAAISISTPAVAYSGTAAQITQTSGSGAAFYQTEGRVQGNGDTWTISAWLYQSGFANSSCNWGWAGSYSPYTKSPHNVLIPSGGTWSHYTVVETFTDKTTGFRDVQATLTGAGTVYIDEVVVSSGAVPVELSEFEAIKPD